MKALRPYQQEALELVWGLIIGKRTEHALVVMATGLGKTVFAAALARKWAAFRGSRMLFLAHTVDILRQARREFREGLHELTSTGILTSDECEALDARLLFATFQSMQGRMVEFGKKAFGLVMVDEAHHGQAVTYREVIEHFEPEFLLGMTATPDRHDGKDIREIFGPEVFDYRLARGLATGWLTPVEYHVMSDNIDITRLRAIIKKVQEGVRVSRKAIDTTIFLPERTEKVVELVREAQGGTKRTIVFCRSIEHIELTLPFFPDALPYHTRTGRRVLHERYGSFREGALKTLLAVNMFNEGIDIPDAELVVFLRMTDSKTVWLQQLGRGLRKTAGKEKLVVFDFVSNCDRVMAVAELEKEVTHHVGGEMPPTFIYKGLDFTIHFDDELRDLVAMLKTLDVELYPTYEEAREAVKKLNPPERGDLAAWYKKNYKRDSRLPSSPSLFYLEKGWKGYKHFFGREEKYQTIQEAMVGLQKLNPPKHGDLEAWYRRNYKRDHLLPASPARFYKDKGWRGYPHFCGRVE